MTDLVTLSHDRGMLTTLQGLLSAYANTMDPVSRPVRCKMIADALALVQAVREEVIADQQYELAAINAEFRAMREYIANTQQEPYGDL